MIGSYTRATTHVFTSHNDLRCSKVGGVFTIAPTGTLLGETFKKLLSFFLALSLTSIARAIPVPTFSLSDLVNSSEVIVTGTITDINEASRDLMTIRGVTQQYQTMHAHVRVDRILKGEVSSPVVTVTFLLPIRESIGYRGLDAAQYRLLLLTPSKGQPNTYELTYSLLPEPTRPEYCADPSEQPAGFGNGRTATGHLVLSS